MSRVKTPDDSQLQALAKELAKNVKSQKDLSDLTSQLVKMTVEAALSSEMEEYLGYAKNSPQGHNTGNNRNGHSRKRLIGDHGEVEIETPRDRNGQFEPQLVKKGQTRLTHFDDQILSLYAKGMSTRDIVATFKEMYGADVSATLISKVTESVIDRVTQWQNRPLDTVYPIVYLSSRSGRISGSSINRFIWHLVSISTAPKKSSGCGCLRPKVQSFGLAY